MFTIITIHIKNPLKNPMNIFPRLQETVEPGFAGRRGWILPQETLGATALNVGNERIIAATPSNPSIPYVKRTSEMTNISKNEDATFFFSTEKHCWSSSSLTGNNFTISEIAANYFLTRRIKSSMMRNFGFGTSTTPIKA